MKLEIGLYRNIISQQRSVNAQQCFVPFSPGSNPVVAELLHQNYQHRQSISIKKVKGEENCGTYVVVGGYKVCRDTTAVQ